MNLIKFQEELNGWWLLIQFMEKDRDKEQIVQLEFFPKIDNLKSMTSFVNNHLNTIHNFGEMTVKGFIRYVPQIVRQKIGDSYRWSGHTENSDGTFDNRRVESMSMTVFGHKTELEKKYPKVYVKTKSGWIPDLLRGHFQELEKANKKIQIEKQFNEEFKKGMAEGNALAVLKKWTVETVSTLKFPDQDPLEKYEEVTIPAMPGYDESCGDTYKPTQGLFQYALIGKNVPTPSHWKATANANFYKNNLHRKSVA